MQTFNFESNLNLHIGRIPHICEVFANAYVHFTNIISNIFIALSPKDQTLFESRFRNFSLYLSNTTIREDGFMCFHENGEVNGSNLTLTVRCEGTGQFVIFYNSRESKSPGDGFSEEAYIELCEVQVIGNYLLFSCKVLLKKVYRKKNSMK